MSGRVLRAVLMTVLLVVGPALALPGTADAPAPPARDGVGAGLTASRAFKWGKSLWDYAWEYGESLSSGPHRGTGPKDGWWQDASDGTGRAVKWGGGVQLESAGNRRPWAGDHGTTTLTLQDESASRGRWEVRHRTDVEEGSATPYRDLIQLVPADGGCARSITIAEINPNGDTITIAANAGGSAWTRTFDGYPQGREHPRNYAVEVTAKKITWFVNGKVVGTLANSAAIPTEAMTVRLGLVGGDADQEMNHTTMIFDWVRGWDLKKGEKPPKGPALEPGTYDDAC